MKNQKKLLLVSIGVGIAVVVFLVIYIKHRSLSPLWVSAVNMWRA